MADSCRASRTASGECNPEKCGFEKKMTVHDRADEEKQRDSVLLDSSEYLTEKDYIEAWWKKNDNTQ